MKKIYALLAGAFVAVSAAAAPLTVGPVSAKLTKMPEVEPFRQSTPMLSISQDQVPDGMQRVIKDGQGNEWSMLIRYLTTCVEGFGMEDQQTGKPYVFEDFPFHVVLMATQPSQNTVYQYYTIWPCAAFCDPDCYTADKKDIDWDKAASIFGSKEAAQAPCSIGNFVAHAYWAQQDGSSIIPVLDGLYGIPSIMPMQRSAIIEGDDSYSYKPCTISNDQLAMQGGSYIIWRSFDEDYNEVAMDFTLAIGNDYSPTTGCVQTATKNVMFALNGDPVILGFLPLVYEIGQLHIFNCGLTDRDSEYGMAYDLEYEPVNRYYLTWCNPSMSYMGFTQQGQEVHSWDSEYLDEGVLHNIQPIASNSAAGDPEFTFFNAALFAPAGEFGLENLTGSWQMPTPKYDANQQGQIIKWNSAPTAYELVPAYYDFGGCEQDGFVGVIKGYTIFPEENLSFIGYGDKTDGFTFRYSAEGWGSNYILGSTIDEAYYHYDINDYNAVKMLPTLGNGTTNVLDSSVEAVESNAPVVNTQYFNLQGQRMNVAPAHGIFIQRDIKADGTVKTMKVAR